MENTKEQAFTSTRTIENDPQYFGAFLNMARYNIFEISNHLSKKMGKTPLKSEDGIPDSFLTKQNDKDFNWRLLYSIAVKHLPVLKVFDDEISINGFSISARGIDFEKMRTDLKTIFKEINTFRNDYSHYYHVINGTNRKITVSYELAKFIRTAYQKAIELIKQRFKSNTIGQDYILEAKDFELCKKLVLVEEDNTITTFGLVFLTTMFLEREYAFLFIGKIKGLKGTQFKSFIATREVFMAYCVRMPHNKLVSQNKTQALALDMINEIAKCPKTLYEVITDDAKQKFLPELSAIKTNNVIENSTNEEKQIIENYEDYIKNIVKRVRHSNRFYYHALRFIDTKNILKNWNFHIELGKVLSKNYKKKIGSEEFNRNIEHNIRTFDKLDNCLPNEQKDRDELAADFLKTIKAKEDIDFTQFAPDYHIKNNKIALAKFQGKISKYKDNKIKQALPDAFLSVHELPKIILLEYLANGKTEEIIDNYVKDVNAKFLNMEFIDKIKNQLPDWNKTFQKRTDKYNNKNSTELKKRKEELNRVLLVHDPKTNIKQIPKRILEYWLNIKDIDDNIRISEYIKLQRLDCKQKLKALEKREKKQETQSQEKEETRSRGKVPKIGEMATFMAKDIVNMIVNKEKKQKITSFYYDKIQECLALYADPKKQQLLSKLLFTELKLKEKGGHPFIEEIKFTEKESTYELYEEYFSAKKSWIDSTFYNKKAGRTKIYLPNDETQKPIPYSYKKLQNEKSNLKKWLDNNKKGHQDTDKKKPIDLPTNLFDDIIIELLKKELIASKISFNNEDKLHRLFKIWWQNERKENNKNYYNNKREYTIYDTKISFKPNSKSKFSDYYEDAIKGIKGDDEQNKLKKKSRQVICNTEADIRILQEQDCMTLLMIEQLLKDEKSDISKTKLSLSNYEDLLGEPITVLQKLTFNKLNEKGEIIKDKKISKKIKDTRKRKDTSLLQKFEYDKKRLPDLFEYYPNTEIIEIATLKEELSEYNKAKEMVFDKAFELEKAIIKKLTAPKEELNVSDNRNIQHQPYLKWLQYKDLINDAQYEFLNNIRNSFSHNQFPKKEKMEIYITNWGNNTKFALTIAQKYEEVINKILKKLEE